MFRNCQLQESYFMKKYIYICTLLSLGLIIFNGYSHSDKPVDAATGAPDEVTCVKCHTGAAMNTEGGTVTIEIGSGITQYQINKDYELTVTSSRADISRFGFEIVAIQKSTGKNVGEFTATDAVRTQKFNASVVSGVREYVGHTTLGIDVKTAGSNSWKLNWKAPAADMGEIVFFASSVMSNANGNRFGDLVYTTSKSINSEVTATEVESTENLFDAFISNEKTISINYTLKNVSPVFITLSDAKGNVLQILKNNIETAGARLEKFYINDHFAGVYFLQFASNQQSQSRKIIF